MYISQNVCTRLGSAVYALTNRLVIVLLALTACTMKDSESDKLRQRRRTTGPTIKNTPTQKRVSTSLVVRRDSSTKRKWGGAVKNKQHWHETVASRYQLVAGRKKKPKGPRAKNSRP